MHNPLRTSTEQYSGQAAVSVHGFPPDSKNPKGLTDEKPCQPFCYIYQRRARLSGHSRRICHLKLLTLLDSSLRRSETCDRHTEW